MYYQINEELARTAHDMNSMRDYIKGETTAEYRAEVDKVIEIAERQKAKYPDEAERIDYLVDKYSRQLAEWYNKNSRIESYCPSWLVSGGSNFPISKKEKQNRMRDNHTQEYYKIQNIVDKIKGAGTGGIKSDDEKAIEKLEARIEKLTELQETMKAVNEHYRKHKTLDGCVVLRPETIQEIKKAMGRDWRSNPKPFESFELSNNNANIRRLKQRLEELKKVKKQETTETEIEAIEGLRVVENVEQMRIQLLFDGKPDEETRTLLKGYGFKWSPKNMAWQRVLNSNGKYVAEKVIEKLKEQQAE